MTNLEINILKCKLNSIKPDHYVLLYLLYCKNFNEIENLFTREYAIKLKNELCTTKYILSDADTPVKQTVISLKEVKKLLNIKDDTVNFWEWYNIYPYKVNNRILRSLNSDSKVAKKHEQKYLSIVKSLEQHIDICNRTKSFVDLQRQNNSLGFLPNIDRVLNNREWETWEITINNTGRWNQRII